MTLSLATDPLATRSLGDSIVPNMAQSQTVLIVDDDPNIRDILRIALGQAGYDVQEAADGLAALTSLGEHDADLVVLDIGLPEADGLDVCRRIRADSSVPILFLTARGDEIDRILGLEMGADDYVTKPFSPREVVARIKAILKRTEAAAAPPTHEDGSFKRGVLELHPERHACRISGTELTLTAREMEILSQLMKRPDQVVARPRLVDVVYGLGVVVSDRTLDSHLRNLRAKLAAAGCPDAIETLHGVGIRMGPCQGA